MLTIFSVPKPFKGHPEIIQRNAIVSWTKLYPSCEIILFGDEEGTKEVALELDVNYVPKVARNEYGTPLINTIFYQAQNLANFPTVCYVNADIILLSDFLPAVGRAASYLTSYLMVGRRWDIDLLKRPLYFSKNWEKKLKYYVLRNGRLHGHSGIDYFVFPKGLIKDMPNFAVGRPGWDSWLVYNVRSRKIPVIDITKLTTVIHQNHDYAHHIQGKKGVFEGPEAQKNLKLAGGYDKLLTLEDASHELTPKGMRKKISLYYFYRYLVTLSATYPLLQPLFKLSKSIFRPLFIKLLVRSIFRPLLKSVRLIINTPRENDRI